LVASTREALVDLRYLLNSHREFAARVPVPDTDLSTGSV
jgi:hypothetical protein